MNGLAVGGSNRFESPAGVLPITTYGGPEITSR